MIGYCISTHLLRTFVLSNSLNNDRLQLAQKPHTAMVGLQHYLISHRAFSWVFRWGGFDGIERLSGKEILKAPWNNTMISSGQCRWNRIGGKLVSGWDRWWDGGYPVHDRRSHTSRFCVRYRYVTRWVAVPGDALHGYLVTEDTLAIVRVTKNKGEKFNLTHWSREKCLPPWMLSGDWQSFTGSNCHSNRHSGMLSIIKLNPRCPIIVLFTRGNWVGCHLFRV